MILDLLKVLDDVFLSSFDFAVVENVTFGIKLIRDVSLILGDFPSGNSKLTTELLLVFFPSCFYEEVFELDEFEDHVADVNVGCRKRVVRHSIFSVLLMTAINSMFAAISHFRQWIHGKDDTFFILNVPLLHLCCCRLLLVFTKIRIGHVDRCLFILRHDAVAVVLLFARDVEMRSSRFEVIW